MASRQIQSTWTLPSHWHSMNKTQSFHQNLELVSHLLASSTSCCWTVYLPLARHIHNCVRPKQLSPVDGDNLHWSKVKLFLLTKTTKAKKNNDFHLMKILFFENVACQIIVLSLDYFFFVLLFRNWTLFFAAALIAH